MDVKDIINLKILYTEKAVYRHGHALLPWLQPRCGTQTAGRGN